MPTLHVLQSPAAACEILDNRPPPCHSQQVPLEVRPRRSNHDLQNRVLCVVALSALLAAAGQPAQAAPRPLRVLFVGGDWKAQLPNYQGKTPMRGYFVRQELEKAAPGRFILTLVTSYEFLQYGDPASLKKYDVIVAGDVMGQSVMPHLVRGLKEFVEGGGGFLYCDNHKAFSFNTRELSFDDVLPIEMVPFRPYDPEGTQPVCSEDKLTVHVAAANHPTMRGLNWPCAAAPGGTLWQAQARRHGAGHFASQDANLGSMGKGERPGDLAGRRLRQR